MNDAFFNVDAERAFIAAILKDETIAEKYGEIVSSQDMYDEADRRLYEAIHVLAVGRKPIGFPSIAESLKRLYGNDNDMQTLTEIVRDAGFSAAFAAKENAQIIRSTAYRRELYQMLDGFKRELLDATNEPDSVHDRARQALRDMVHSGHDWKPMSDVMMSTYSMLERKAKGEDEAIECGLRTLDKYTTGWHKGELTIVAARPSVGKSAFGVHVALEAAKRGYKVGVVSREMTDEQYGLRIVARDTGIDNYKLRRGTLDDAEWERASESLLSSGSLGINFLFDCRTVEDLRTAVQQKVDSDEMDLLIIDYLQLLQSNKRFEKDYQRIGYVSRAIKDMALDFRIPIISLAQVGRSGDGRMPTLAELRGSGDIEQDADNVIFIHRPTSADDNHVPDEDKMAFSTFEQKGMQYIVLGIAKQRQGETGDIPVVFIPSRMQFTGIAREADDGRRN